MSRKLIALITLAACSWAAADPVYTAKGELVPPTQYREWVYLSTGMNMSYLKSPGIPRDMFSNVFVNPEAYREFVRTGTWPDKTVMVLELRGATNKGSINQEGFYQGSEVVGVEFHIKDTTRFEGGWAFFPGGKGPSTRIPYTADCYSCHKAHAAVDTTFVQFYPTLMEIATKKGTLSAAYQAEQKAGAVP
jgi:Cytochrome P460